MLKATPAVRHASIILRSVSLLLISALLAPAIVIGEAGKDNLVRTASDSDRPRTAPVSAPPEPFHIGTPSTKPNLFASFTARLTASLVNFPTSFGTSTATTTKKLPAESDEAELQGQSSESIQPLPAPPPAGTINFDFDGDGKADIGRWHSATTEFKVKNSGNGSFTTNTIGSSSAKAAPGNFDGDSKTDAAVFNAGTWTIKNSSNGATQTIAFGQAGDIPMAGNYDGDAFTDTAILRPSTGTWWVRESSTGYIIPHGVLGAGDIAVPGDYDGDGKTNIAVYRPSTGVWSIYGPGGTVTYTWGTGSDIPVPADYDGDNKTDVAVYRRTTGTWYVIGSQVGIFTQVWGNYGDQPTPADYNGDNKADFSVWRPTTGMWHTIYSTSLTFDTQSLGVAGDTAVSSAYLKQIGGTVSSYDLAQARLSPKNATGGTDLYSRNFSWGTSLVNLPGRAGMNAGFGMSYNSLVWTKSGSEVHFDADTSNISPRLPIRLSNHRACVS